MKRDDMRSLVVPLTLGLLTACAAQDMSSVTAPNANEVHAIGKKLRDRCDRTQGFDACNEWVDYQNNIELSWQILSYPEYLAHWEKRGPY